MTLRLDDTPNLISPLDEWPLPTVLPFVESSAQIWLARDVRRFVDGRVSGRSYLIAGHRGSGKTAMVTRVIDLIRAEMMRSAVRAEGANLADRPFQRPLLVKLHGPSMFAPPRSDPAPGSTAPATAGSGQNAGGDRTGQQTATGDAAAAAKPPPPPSPGVHAALIQMSIGLYRALAAEAATGYRAHARVPRLERPGDRRELAAQLALDLDGGIAPERLREYWLRIGRLRFGVLWPKSADATLETCRMDDQGFREIVAIATASQAFQVCSGRVSYATTKKNSDSKTEVSETKGSTDVRDLIDRIGTLGISALAGATVFGNGNGAAAAVGAGVLTWFLGSLTISWSRSRTRQDDRVVDYSFIRDQDPATLDRDLPVVITRLREAGLAPVFVVDELDKLNDAADKIIELVSQLKHLIVDFGFFCFLVDRSCYVEFQRRIDLGGYPPEHTLFSERLLLTPEADPLYRFLMSRVVADPWDDVLAARAVFVLSTMHEARMNLTEVMRVLTRAVRAADGSIGETADLLQQRRQIVATVQVAINEAMRIAPIDDRVAASPSFAQLAVDTLYYPSVGWAKGETAIDASRDKLRTYLKQRILARARDPGKTDDSVDEVVVAESDIALLQGALVDLLEMLTDLTKVRAAAKKRRLSGEPGEPGDDEARLSEVVPSEVPAIVKSGSDGIYRFIFDRDGEPIGTTAGRLSVDQIKQATEYLSYADAFLETLVQFRVTVDELVTTPLMAGLSSDLVGKACEGVRVAVTLGTSSADTLQHIAILERLQREVARSSASLGRLLVLAAGVRIASRRGDGIVPIIRRLLPLSASPDNWLDAGEALDTVEDVVSGWSATADGLREWCKKMLSMPAPLVAKSIPSPEDYQRLVTFFDQALAGRRIDFRFRFDDLVMAALDQLPYRSVSLAPETMTALDWSSLALAALPTGVGTSAMAPYWVLPAALKGLGFGLPSLSELIDHDAVSELQAARFIVSLPEMNSDECMKLAAKFVSGAVKRPAGTVVIDTEDENYGRAPPSADRPTLIVKSAVLDDYAQGLNWLKANGILSIGADARRPEASDAG